MKIELDFLLENHKELSKIFYDHMCDQITNPEIISEIRLIQERNDRYIFKLYYIDNTQYSLKDMVHSIYIASEEELIFTNITKIPNYTDSLIRETNAFIKSTKRDQVLEEFLEE